jgi:c-di-GMP-binding flagellar brake protein YcgR
LITLIIEAFRRKDEHDGRAGETQSAPNPRLQLKHISTAGNRISLDIGSRIKMQFNGLEATLDSTLVGMLPDCHLIVTTPAPLAAVSKAVASDARIIVKYVDAGRLCMFKSLVLKEIDAPSHLLFLAYPPVIHYHELRKAKRTNIFIPCTVHLQGKEEFYGVLIDLSTAGGLCLIKTRGNGPIPLDIGNEVHLRCCYPASRKSRKLPEQ